MNPVVFFGYWSGALPPVTDLHFRSFVHHHPEQVYELWLDTDAASSIDAPELQWIKSHPRIRIRPFSLDALIQQHVTGQALHRYNRWQGLKKLGRKLHRIGGAKGFGAKAFDHALFGPTYQHSSALFGGFRLNKAYRGDLARCLIPMAHYEQPSLYADLDVCFTSNLLDLCGATAFSYRWESFGFANSALLYLPGKSLSEALVRRGCELENFLPWILFTDENCNALGIQIHPTTMFDPLWSPGSVLFGSPGLFFKGHSDLSAVMSQLKRENYRAIHWHNNWRTTPAPDSVFRALLAESS